jgi:hypothetical protein
MGYCIGVVYPSEWWGTVFVLCTHPSSGVLYWCCVPVRVVGYSIGAVYPSARTVTALLGPIEPRHCFSCHIGYFISWPAINSPFIGYCTLL